MTSTKEAVRHGGRAAVFSLGNLAFLVAQFVLLTLVARLGDPLLLGAYGLSMAILNPLFFLANFGMRRALAVDMSGRFVFSTYRKARNYLIAASLILALIILPILPEDTEVRIVFAILLVAKIADSMCDLEYGFLLRQMAPHRIGVSFTLRGALSVLLYIAAFLVTSDAVWSLLTLPAGWIAVYLFHDRRYRRRITRDQAQGSGAGVTALLLHLWPLALGDAMIQFQQSFPRLMVERTFDLATLGALLPGFQVYTLVLALGNSVTQAILPHLANRIHAQDWEGIGGTVIRTMALALPVLAIGILLSYLLGPFMIELVFGHEYALSGEALGLLSLAWTFRLLGVVLQNYVLAGGRFSALFRVQIAVSLIHLIAVIGLWYLIGLNGIFWGLIAGNAAFLAAMVWEMRTRGASRKRN